MHIYMHLYIHDIYMFRYIRIVYVVSQIGANLNKYFPFFSLSLSTFLPLYKKIHNKI